MNAPARIVRWSSTIDASRCGIELLGFEPASGRLESKLDQVLGSLDGVNPSFVIVSVPSFASDVSTAISQLSNFLTSAHVCFALDHETLLTLDPRWLRDLRFGVLLDGVNAETPLGAFGAECVEAVRFDGEFAKKASRDLRLSCVMESVLRLARELGVASLRSPLSPEHRDRGEFKFDYIAASEFSEVQPA
jgi:hypothetical protein